LENALWLQLPSGAKTAISIISMVLTKATVKYTSPGGRQKHWIKNKSRNHHAFDRVKEAFCRSSFSFVRKVEF